MALFRCEDHCIQCGKNKREMSFVGGDWWCRDCLWKIFYQWDAAVNYCLLHREDFCEDYPEGENWMHRMLMTGETDGESHVEEFISENLEDYCDWMMENPLIVPVEELKGRKR